MKNIQDHRKIYKSILDNLEKASLLRADLIRAVLSDFKLSKSELGDRRTNGRMNVLRSMCGTIINDMHSKGVLSRDSEYRYHINTSKPIAIRLERCEEEILNLLHKSPCTKDKIKNELVKHFKTDTTSTVKDDNQLFTFIGQILKTLVAEKMLSFDGALYSIQPSKTAELKNRGDILSIKADFLAIIHSKGGEFFEHYFMNLLEKYLIRCGKTVTESYVSGGSADGGIDGIAKTADSLGFKETIMVQTKNRNDIATETDIRGFYGAVCAAQGSRGIYAITSDFHPMARKLLDSIDNCVGVNGDKIFSMAVDTSYGIIRNGNKIEIDHEALNI